MLHFKKASATTIALTQRHEEITPIGTVVIPPGYETDGASIPKWAWPIVGPPIAGAHLRAAVVHDWLCDSARIHNDYGLRVMADAVFFYVLYNTPEIPRWKRTVMYLAVRTYGRITYKTVKQGSNGDHS